MRHHADLHVHTEWSPDAPEGSMEDSCERALRFGLPTIAFTDHADFGSLQLAPLDVEGYWECVERCRARFPGLKILTGVEVGEAHRFPAETAALLAARPFEFVLGSLHSIAVGDRLVCIGEEGTLDAGVAHENVRAFLADTVELIEKAPVFAALTHLDYPKRYWPHEVLPYREEDFEEEYRAVLGALAQAGMALEINTNGGDLIHGPCPGPTVVRWWYELGGEAVSFASDAHDPLAIMAGFDVASDAAQAAGFRPCGHDFGVWLR